jgi:hypothetical protein
MRSPLIQITARSGRGPPPPEQFVECSPPPELKEKVARLFQAPRTDLEGYNLWKTGIGAVADWLSRYQREVQLVAAVPLPLVPSDVAITNLGISSAFVQLVYPLGGNLWIGKLTRAVRKPRCSLEWDFGEKCVTSWNLSQCGKFSPRRCAAFVSVLTREQLDKTSLIGTKSEYT